jgi:hypothetical protein
MPGYNASNSNPNLRPQASPFYRGSPYVGGQRVFNPSTQSWAPATGHMVRVGDQPDFVSSYSGGGGGGYGGGGVDPNRAGAFAALANEVRNQPLPRPIPVPKPYVRPPEGTPYDMAAENAAYGRAKERTGLATQAALKNLRAEMVGTGRSGAGLGNEALSGLFSRGVGELADTDRQLAEARAGRAFGAQQRDIDREIASGQWTTEFDQSESAREAGSRESRLARLLQVYGMWY